jgi:hypothetical protein
MVIETVRILIGLLLIVAAIPGCATMGETPAVPPPGVFSAEATLPPPGTRWVVKATTHNETTRQTEAQSITWSALGRGTYSARPVAILWDGTNIHLHDPATGGWMALLDANAREIISHTPHEGQISSPLWVGKSWVARSTWRSRIHGRTVHDVVVVWKVAAYEEIEVPAGRFKAFRLDAWPDERGLVRKRTDWYAPSLGLVVKSVIEGLGTPYAIGVGSDRIKFVAELVEHATPAEAATRGDASYARLAAGRALISLGAGAPDAARDLMTALMDAATPTPAAAGRAPGTSSPASEALLKDVSDDARTRAVSALAALAATAPEAVAILTEVARDPGTPLSTVWMLASISGPGSNAVPVLLEILQTDPDAKLRRAVIDVIGRLGAAPKDR